MVPSSAAAKFLESFHPSLTPSSFFLQNLPKRQKSTSALFDLKNSKKWFSALFNTKKALFKCF
jgi:hypothetical protein